MALHIHTTLSPVTKFDLPAKKPVQPTFAPFAAATTVVEVAEPVVEIHQPKIDTGHAVDELLVNEYIELHTLYQSIDGKNVAERMEAIKKTLQSIANDNLPPDQVAIFEAQGGEIEFSKRTTACAVTEPAKLLEKLIAQFGVEAVASVVKIGVTDVKKLMSEAELKGFVSYGPGHRTLKSVRPA